MITGIYSNLTKAPLTAIVTNVFIKEAGKTDNVKKPLQQVKYHSRHQP